MLVDSHCHLNYPDFEKDLEATLERASESGVLDLLTICTKIEEFPSILSLTKKYENIFCSVGVHPHNVETCQKVRRDCLLKLSENCSVIGFGETGFDFYYENSSRLSQEVSFRAHIEASRDAGLPVIVHTRDAEQDTIRVIREEYERGPFLGVIHCFSSSLEFAQEALSLGFYISISGIVTFKNADVLRETISKIPLNRLLLETDAPYHAPVPKRGKRNEPAFVNYIAEKVAEIQKIETDHLIQVTRENFFTLFSKAKNKR